MAEPSPVPDFVPASGANPDATRAEFERDSAPSTPRWVKSFGIIVLALVVLSAADQLGAPLPGTALIFQLYRTLQAQGLGAEGNHALIKALEHLAGFEVGTKS